MTWNVTQRLSLPAHDSRDVCRYTCTTARWTEDERAGPDDESVRYGKPSEVSSDYGSHDYVHSYLAVKSTSYLRPVQRRVISYCRRSIAPASFMVNI